MIRTGVVLFAVSFGAAGVAVAQGGLDPVLSSLAAQGYGGFEIKREAGQLKVEAHSGGVERELVYDAATGALLKDEVGRSDDRPATGAPSPRLRDVYATLQSRGFTNFDIEEEDGRIEVDVEEAGRERDLVFDAATGALIAERVGDDRPGRDDDRVDRDDDDDDRGGNSGPGGRDDDRDDGRDDDGGRDDDDDDSGGNSGRGGDDDRGGGDDDD